MNVLFENEACLVINKHCGEVGQMSVRQMSVGQISTHLRPVHRLDTPASGCLLLAKTREAAAFLSAAFASTGKDKAVEKRYWAIVEKPRNETPLSAEWQEAIHWIQCNPRLNKSFAHTEARVNAKKALLRWRLASSGDRYLFLELELITGRHHQIRAQLAALGLHIKGDLKYGARRSERSDGIRLHARSLCFPNPMNRQSILVEAPPPFMDTLWQAYMQTISN